LLITKSKRLEKIRLKLKLKILDFFDDFLADDGGLILLLGLLVCAAGVFFHK
jgi:hypothetical protein